MISTSWPCIFIARPNPCVTSPNPPTFASGANSAVTCAIFFGLFVSSVAVFPSKSSSGSFFGLVSQNGFLSSSPTGHPSAVIGNGHSISDSLLGSVRSAPTAAFFRCFCCCRRRRRLRRIRKRRRQRRRRQRNILQLHLQHLQLCVFSF